MLHKTKSGKTALLKYVLSVPLFAVILIFSSATSKIEKYAKRIDNISLNAVKINEAVAQLKVDDNKPQRILQTVEISKKEEPVSPVEPAEENLTGTIALPVVTLQEEKIFITDSAAVPMESVEVLPAFPGGPKGWAEFLSANYNYPAAAREQSIAGTMLLSFIVERNGSLTDIMVVRDPIGFGTAEEAVRLLKMSPKWTPGIQNGMKVRVAYTQPITLKLN